MRIISGILLAALLLPGFSWQPQPRALFRSVVTSAQNKPQLSPLAYSASSVASSASAEDSEPEEWTKQRLHNTAAFRSAAILSALALASQSPVSLSASTTASLHVLAFGTWFGTVAYTTFVAGITMFKNLPRKMFGKLQSKLFPKYFMLSSATLVIQLVTLQNLTKISRRSTTALGVALAMTLLNQFYLEPVSTNNMMERYKLEAAGETEGNEEYAALKAAFGKWHGLSSLTNLIALCAGAAHAIYLASALVV